MLRLSDIAKKLRSPQETQLYLEYLVGLHLAINTVNLNYNVVA